MGVPLLYRWLSERYPLINRSCRTLPTPEIDNLYLDANGILHKCSHGDDGGAGSAGAEPTFDEIAVAICSYIEHLVTIARPRRLLYIAIDGVAPRAKMNQQRQRRYRVAREREKKREGEAGEGADPPAPADAHTAHADTELATETRTEARTEPLTENRASSEPSLEEPTVAVEGFDSNAITPGTEFMERLVPRIAFFLRHKLQTDAAWRFRASRPGAFFPPFFPQRPPTSWTYRLQSLCVRACVPFLGGGLRRFSRPFPPTDMPPTSFSLFLLLHIGGCSLFCLAGGSD